jgi:cation diffusion facilitator family transporter
VSIFLLSRWRPKYVPSSSSKQVVNAAIAASLGIAICKYIAALFTGSPAMLSEAVHSTIDTGNESLLLLGMRRSQRRPDALHPFGHGKVLYFYSFLVAVYIFALGGGFAAYQGISHLRHPLEFKDLGWNYAALAIAALFESYSWRISYKELLKRKDPDESTWDEIIGSKDPAIFTIFLEDTAALIGIFLAFLGILLGHTFHNPYFDPIASVCIGALLGFVAIVLARESGALLVGERTNRARIRRLDAIIRADESVNTIGELFTMQLGPDQVLLAVDVKFRPELTVRQLESIIDGIEARIRKQEPAVVRVFIEPDSLRESGRAASQVA